MIQKRILSIFLLLATLFAHAQESPKYEIRAVWLTTIGGIDWPHFHQVQQQKEELCLTLDKLKKAGINTVMLQTRIRATTLYPSALEPFDACLTGKAGHAPSYDPLQLAIDECHKRGMQLHAWVVTIPVGKWNSYGCQQLRKKMPGLIVRIGDEGYMDPEQDATASYLASCCREIVEKYDVDGIHLDYIRYPEKWRNVVKANKTRSKSRKTSLSSQINAITRIVRTIHHEVKAIKPWVMLSCSPIGKHDDLSRYSSGGWNARRAVAQDAQQWLKEGLMDALFPMMYFRDNQFFPFAIDWQENSYGRLIVPGLGIYFLDPKEGRWQLNDIKRQMYVSRQLGMGHCFFRSKFLIANQRGIYDFTSHFDAHLALVPPMTWLSSEPPVAPMGLTLKEGVLSWSDTERHVYNIYASPDFPIDISDAKNLVATRITGTSVRVPYNPSLNYAVTAQDRYGLESRACQLLVNAGSQYSKPAISITDGRPVALPAKSAVLDADFVIVETLLGQQLQVSRYQKGTLLDVSALPDGMYQLRSLGRKDRNHRIGFFVVKRLAE